MQIEPSRLLSSGQTNGVDLLTLSLLSNCERRKAVKKAEKLGS
jgi:hypothetical protein